MWPNEWLMESRLMFSCLFPIDSYNLSYRELWFWVNCWFLNLFYLSLEIWILLRECFFVFSNILPKCLKFVRFSYSKIRLDHPQAFYVMDSMKLRFIPTVGSILMKNTLNLTSRLICALLVTRKYCCPNGFCSVPIGCL